MTLPWKDLVSGIRPDQTNNVIQIKTSNMVKLKRHERARPTVSPFVLLLCLQIEQTENNFEVNTEFIQSYQ